MPTDYGQLYVRKDNQPAEMRRLVRNILTIGREPDNGLQLSSPYVSSRHAELRVEGPGAFLTDLNSTNGTYIHGHRIPANQPVALSDEAVFQIGPFLLMYRAAREEETAAVVQPQPETVEPTEAHAIAVQAAEEVMAAEVVAPAAAATETPASPALRTEGRETYEIPLPPAGCSRYLEYLPIIFHEDPFMGQFLQILESAWEPCEQRQDHIDMYFGAYTCPASFLPWIAGWIDYSFDARWSEARRRRLLANAMRLYRWRGTAQGLKEIIEVCTDLHAEIVEDTAQPFVFRVSVAIPRGSGVTRVLLEELIQAHKPAYAGYVLEATS